MKKLLWLFLVCFLFIGVGSAKEYETETLKEACDIENLTCEHEDRVYDENLPNIYIFRGNGCPYCNRLLTFISSIADDYEVNIVVYEVKDNDDNWDLYRKVGAKFDFTPSGYPYTVIGEETFDGYASDYDEDIKSALEKLVETENPYDVVEDVENGNTTTTEKDNTGIVLTFVFGMTVMIGMFLGYKLIVK